MYLAVKGTDLRDHGFGSFNVWHYPHDDINQMYDAQLKRHDLDDPWLFMSTPTLHTDAPGLCPPGHQILEVATCADYAQFADLRRCDRRAYNVEKKRIRERILDVIQARYVPRLRDHLALRLVGTPATNERFCRAPAGNAYGAALTPEHVTLGRRPFRTQLDNLWMANATAGLPSIAGEIGAGMRLYGELTGDVVRLERPVPIGAERAAVTGRFRTASLAPRSRTARRRTRRCTGRRSCTRRPPGAIGRMRTS
jgi:phytoene dehydrogenase-like protein